MVTRTTRTGRAAPGLFVSAAAALIVSSMMMTGCSSKEPPKPASTTPAGGTASTTPAGGATPAPDVGKTGTPAADPAKTPAASTIPAVLPTGALAYVPKDAFVFVQVKPKRLFASELIKALPESLFEEFEEKLEQDNPFDIDPREIETFSLSVLPPKPDAGPFGTREIAAVLTYSEDLDPQELVAAAKKKMGEDGPRITEQTHQGKKYWRIAPPEPSAPKVPALPPGAKDDDEETETEAPAAPAAPEKAEIPAAMIAIDAKSILIGHEPLVLSLLAGTQPGPVAERLKGVSLDQDLIAVVFPNADPIAPQVAAGAGAGKLPPDAQEKIGGQIEKTKAIFVGLDLTGSTLLSLILENTDADTTNALTAQAKTGAQMLQGTYQNMTGPLRLDEAPAEEKTAVLFGDKLLAGLNVDSAGNELKVTIKNPGGWDALKPVFAKAAEKAAEAKARLQKQNNFKMIGLAAHNYHDAYKGFPPGKDAKGNQLSWRVHLLPYLDQPTLYDEFHLDEPWDSEHNKALIARMPKIFASDEVEEEGKTRIISFAGLIFGGDAGKRISEITDGTSNTIMALEVAPEKAVIWTKPDDPKFDEDDPKAALGELDDVFIAVFCDGFVRTLSSEIKDAAFKALVTPAGGEVVDRDDLK